ncbi:NHL repeat-containing protein [Tellurirhabdus rosea]|uniref:hypothetical protein n=1 Tax=Tellurirhabdus rosea TaxID=2674997 RepID=UPI00224DA9ED|nr:hypothetical protein [Tellurirhabdus rosea]
MYQYKKAGFALFACAGALLASCKSSDVAPVKEPDQYKYTYSKLTGGQSGGVDGNLAEARFNKPTALALDAQDNLYVLDKGNYAIRVISKQGVVSTLKTSAGKKVDINSQSGSLVVAKDGTIYLAEYTSVAKISKDGVKTTLCGTITGTSPDGYKDDVGEKARFRTLSGIALFGEDLLVADKFNHVIRKIKLDGTVTTFAGIANKSGYLDGSVDKATLYYPTRIAADAAKNVYISEDFGNTIRQVTPDGQVKIFAGSGAAGGSDGTGKAASFSLPTGIWSTPKGYLIVADVVNSSIRLVSPKGVVTTLYKGKYGIDALNDVAVDSKSNIYFTEPGSHTISKLTAE